MENKKVCEGRWFNSGGTTVTRGKKKASYQAWVSLKTRLTNKDVILTNDKGKVKFMTHICYDSCDIVPEWLDYRNFEEWYDSSYYSLEAIDNKLYLDKDIAIQNNNLYGPDNCLLVPKRINNYFINSDNVNPRMHGIMYRVIANDYIPLNEEYTRKPVFITGYDREDAIQNYRDFKTQTIRNVVLPDFMDSVAEEDLNNPMVKRVVEALSEYRF